MMIATRGLLSPLVRVLQAAGVSFAILGNEETCTGDAARRAGNEYLFQMLAQENIETLNRYKVKRIVASCPHCFNTLKHEYPQFGGTYDVIHHSQLIAELIDSGQLRLPQRGAGAPIVYHDPCYLGRYNGVYEPARHVLGQATGRPVVEMPRSRSQSFCCGAGGARNWMEESRGTRINQSRAAEALATGAAALAVACPFCMGMLSDGVRAGPQPATAICPCLISPRSSPANWRWTHPRRSQYTQRRRGYTPK